MSEILKRARELREVIETVVAAADDKTASQGVELSPGLKQDGSLIAAGTRIKYQGRLYRAAVDMWDTAENAPDAAPSVWEEVAYKDGIRIIPATVTVTSQFAKDELGWWGEQIYKSLIDANVYTPEQYAAGWELQ